jgi:hypothetical protein
MVERRALRRGTLVEPTERWKWHPTDPDQGVNRSLVLGLVALSEAAGEDVQDEDRQPSVTEVHHEVKDISIVARAHIHKAEKITGDREAACYDR